MQELQPTGERLIPSQGGINATEHLHRYALSLELAVGKDVLDVACGEGYGSSLLAEVAKKVTGLDIDKTAIAHASKKYRKDNLNFLVGDCVSVPLSNQSLDLVVSFETLEHISSHDEFINEIKRVLKTGGILFISTPIKGVYHHGQAPNPFHKKEVDEIEFVSMLRNHFRNVKLLSQRFTWGSLVIPKDEISSHPDFICLKGDFHGFSRDKDQESGVYIIGVASDHEIPAINWGLFTLAEEKDHLGIQSLYAQIEAIKGSTSWKLTAPLRCISNFIKSIVLKLFPRKLT
jgi:SAM-dependent methyltransferase